MNGPRSSSTSQDSSSLPPAIAGAHRAHKAYSSTVLSELDRVRDRRHRRHLELAERLELERPPTGAAA